MAVLTSSSEVNNMQKLIQSIQNAQTALKISQSELSRRLGKGRNYLSNAQDGCTTAKRDEIIDMINRVVAGEVFKSDDAIIAELSEKLENAHQHNRDHQINERALESRIRDLNFELRNLTEDNLKLKESITSLKAESDQYFSRLNATQTLLNQSEENTLYWISKVPATRWGAFKLFIKMMLGGGA